MNNHRDSSFPSDEILMPRNTADMLGESLPIGALLVGQFDDDEDDFSNINNNNNHSEHSMDHQQLGPSAMPFDSHHQSRAQRVQGTNVSNNNSPNLLNFFHATSPDPSTMISPIQIHERENPTATINPHEQEIPSFSLHNHVFANTNESANDKDDILQETVKGPRLNFNEEATMLPAHREPARTIIDPLRLRGEASTICKTPLNTHPWDTIIEDNKFLPKQTRTLHARQGEPADGSRLGSSAVERKQEAILLKEQQRNILMNMQRVALTHSSSLQLYMELEQRLKKMQHQLEQTEVVRQGMNDGQRSCNCAKIVFGSCNTGAVSDAHDLPLYNTNSTHSTRICQPQEMLGPNLVLLAPPALAANTQQPLRKRKRRPKAKDAPKRPLSAYNLFFKDERAKMLKSLKEATTTTMSNDGTGGEASSTASSEDQSSMDSSSSSGNTRAVRHVHDREEPPEQSPKGLGFARLAQTIAAKWKQIDDETLAIYEKRAAEEMKLYKKAVREYEEKKRQQHDDGGAFSQKTTASTKRMRKLGTSTSLSCEKGEASAYDNHSSVLDNRPVLVIG